MFLFMLQTIIPVLKLIWCLFIMPCFSVLCLVLPFHGPFQQPTYVSSNTRTLPYSHIDAVNTYVVQRRVLLVKQDLRNSTSRHM